MASRPKMSRDEKRAAKAAAAEQARGAKRWRMLGTGAAMGAGLLTAKALDATWKTATGRTAPDRVDNPDLSTRDALLWAALSGVAISVAKTYATRRAATYWVKSTGRLPPGMDHLHPDMDPDVP